jgi:hypothetical protein
MFNRGRYEASRCQQRFVKLRCTRGVGERTLDAKKSRSSLSESVTILGDGSRSDEVNTHCSVVATLAYAHLDSACGGVRQRL